MKQKSKAALVFGVIPVLAAALTVGGRYTWDHWLGSAPRLECPRTLDLGEKERGEIAIGRFHIRNSGWGTLTVSDFSTSCSCAGVEKEVEGRFFRVTTIQLSPGEEINLLVRVGVAAKPGDNQLVNVLFATNDPDHPKWQMDVIVTRVAGGYVAEPAAVVFDSFPLGKKPTQTIHLYDNGKPNRAVEEVHSTRPDHFTAILLPLSEKDEREVHQTTGKLFARIKVTVNSEVPGRIDGELQVSLKDEKHPVLPIPVLGEAVSLAEPRPSMLVLPRYVGNKSVRSGEVLIFNRYEKPIEVVVDSLPSGITAELRVISGHPDQRLLNIEWHPGAKRNQKPSSEVHVRLRVRPENEETNLEVPILLTEDGSL